MLGSGLPQGKRSTSGDDWEMDWNKQVAAPSCEAGGRKRARVAKERRDSFGVPFFVGDSDAFASSSSCSSSSSHARMMAYQQQRAQLDAAQQSSGQRDKAPNDALRGNAEWGASAKEKQQQNVQGGEEEEEKVDDDDDVMTTPNALDKNGRDQSKKAMSSNKNAAVNEELLNLSSKIFYQFQDDLAKLWGAKHMSEYWQREISRSTHCMLCEEAFYSEEERLLAVQNLSDKIRLLNKKETAIDNLLDALRTRGYAPSPSDTTSSSSLSAAVGEVQINPLRRMGFVTFFRSIRSEGMKKNRFCPVCSKPVANLERFLSTLDRFSYLAEKRFFDSAVGAPST